MITRLPDYDLTARNTFRMMVRCSLWLEFSAPEDLKTLDFKALPQPVKVIGGGSNLLFTKDFPGTLLHSTIGGIQVLSDRGGEVLVRVGSGVRFDDFCAWASSENLWGPENLSLIPGDVGAAAVQNIGAYGVEANDVVFRVNTYDLVTNDYASLENEKCAYGYRDSIFKHLGGRYIITSVDFLLSREPRPKLDYGGVRKALPTGAELTPQLLRDTIIGIRRAKLPDPEEIGSAGSFFCNPVIDRDYFSRIVEIARSENGAEYAVPHYEVGDRIKVPAAWMIDQCGFKGQRNGGAQVFPTQPLVIINESGHASPDDVVGLECRIIETVRAKYGVTLHPEVEHV